MASPIFETVFEVSWFDAGHGSLDTEERIAHQELMLRYAYRALAEQHLYAPG